MRMKRKGSTRVIGARVIDMEMGSFVFLVFGTNGGMGKECKLFLSNQADKLSRNKRQVVCQCHILA